MTLRGHPRTPVLGLTSCVLPGWLLSPGPTRGHRDCFPVHPSAWPAWADTQTTNIKEKRGGKKTPREAPPRQAEILQEARGDLAPVQMFLLPSCPSERLKIRLPLKVCRRRFHIKPGWQAGTPPPPRRKRCTDISTHVHTQTHMEVCIFIYI